MKWLRSERERAASRHRLDQQQRQQVWAVAAALLDYPSAEMLASLAQLDEALVGVPDDFAQPLRDLSARLASVDVATAQSDYVETFDHTRRCALYLTYFAFGDTRRRGVALVQFKQAYRQAGVEFESDELPDHLCVVLQFGAFHDPAGAWKLLLDHRAGVEMLRLALLDRGSPYAAALAVICESLPPLRGDETEAIAQLISQGPPAEEVGLQPYMIDPRTTVQPTTTEFIGMPS